MNQSGKDSGLPGEVIGLIPAGGQASRLAPLPLSKELYPLGFRPADEGDGRRPKVVCHYLLEKMRRVGLSKVYIVLRQGKWDIPSYFGDGAMLDLHLCYLMMGLPFGVPYTLDQAYPFVKDAVVVFGFPDIIFEPDDAFVQLLNRRAATNADVVLGVFRANVPQQCDMIDLDEDGRVRRILIKPQETELLYTWNIAVWTPGFTEFMHQYLAGLQESIGRRHGKKDEQHHRELIVGDIIHSAIQNDLHVEGVVLADCNYLDIGTPDDLARAIRELNCADD